MSERRLHFVQDTSALGYVIGFGFGTESSIFLLRRATLGEQRCRSLGGHGIVGRVVDALPWG